MKSVNSRAKALATECSQWRRRHSVGGLCRVRARVLVVSCCSIRKCREAGRLQYLSLFGLPQPIDGHPSLLNRSRPKSVAQHKQSLKASKCTCVMKNHLGPNRILAEPSLNGNHFARSHDVPLAADEFDALPRASGGLRTP